MIESKPFARGALYYPYIHIHNVNWLKANLIIFPCVKRMLPINYLPNEREVYKFTQPFLKKPPLLRRVMIDSPRSRDAQAILATKLKESSRNKAFLKRYGRDGTRKSLMPQDLGFQLHRNKLIPDLLDVLLDTKKQLNESERLAWPPINREGYDFSKGYIEVNPRVGEVVMSTIAIACAQHEGLDIVGDERSKNLHHTLLEKDLDPVYDSWLGPNKKLTSPKTVTGEKLLEFILGFKGDLSTLSLRALYSIAAQREPVEKLINALREKAATIPPMDDGPQMDEAFKDLTSQVMRDWKADRKNLRGYAKTFFGGDAAKLTSDFASSVAEKSLTIAPTAAAGWIGSLMAGGLVGAGAGLVVGLLAHSGTSYYKIHQREKDSPYRFLTTLENAGVVFRSDVLVDGKHEQD